LTKKVAFHTLGCKLNFSETSAMSDKFIKEGYEIVEFNNFADIYVINTCSVTENAEKECRQIVRRVLRNNPNSFVAVTGCYAQLRPEEIASIEGVDIILGADEKFNILSYIDDLQKKELSCIYVSPLESLTYFHSSLSFEGNNRTRGFLKIQDGCDYKCSFCTIPLARGKSRSMEHNKLLEEFNALLAAGYKEIILTGVNVGDYKDKDGVDFYNLLKKILGLDGEFRIRISSIEPNLLSDKIIELAASEPKICDHFHIPLQSGNDKILKLMQRRYNSDFYRDRIYKVVEKIENVGIGVDVIVGFPGETEEDFLVTYNFLRDLPISYLHVFTYSERPDTKAILMNNSVNLAERKRRTNMLRILSDKKKNEFYRKMEGLELDILFENENYDGVMKGFSSNYIKVAVPYVLENINKFVKINFNFIENLITGS